MLCDPVRFLEESVTIRVKFQQDCVEAERKLNPFWKKYRKIRQNLQSVSNRAEGAGQEVEHQLKKKPKHPEKSSKTASKEAGRSRGEGQRAEQEEGTKF